MILPKFLRKALSRYANNALWIDLAIVFLLFNVPYIFVSAKFITLDQESFEKIADTILSADFSIAGFVLAALTIIVTFKATVKEKNLKQEKSDYSSPMVHGNKHQKTLSAFELLFNSKHYYHIVFIFKNTCSELIVTAFIVYVAWIYCDLLSEYQLFSVVIGTIYMTFISTLRSLYILFDVLSLEKYSVSNQKT